jgi:hypothetical protein
MSNVKAAVNSGVDVSSVERYGTHAADDGGHVRKSS